MEIAQLGHVVLKVKDLERSEGFYCGLLGLSVSARAPEWSMLFLSLGQHHDVALLEIGDEAPQPASGTLGLDHLAFKLAGGVDALAGAKRELEAAGLSVAGVDHVVTKSLYLLDPDGNKLEIYVDGEAGWRDDPSLILSDAVPLEL